MGFFRTSGVVFVSVLFLLSILSLNSLFVLSDSLEYDNVKSSLGDVMDEVLYEDLNDEGEFDDTLELLREYCNEFDTDKFTFNVDNHTFEFFCDDVNDNNGDILEDSMSNFVEAIYYKQYSCEFWNCLGENKIFILVSDKAHNYWQKNMYYSLLIFLALAVILFLLVEKKKNFFIISGALVLFSSFPFLKLKFLLRKILGEEFYRFVAIFVSSSDYVFWVAFIGGVILLAIGILWHFFNWGEKLSRIVNRMSSKN